MIIAIPTFNRPDILQKKTLSMLKFNKIENKNIYIFLHNENQKDKYNIILKDYENIIISNATSLIEQRNFITNYFPINEKILCIDDDVSELYDLQNDEFKPTQNLKEIATKGWDLLDKHKCSLFGINPIKNAYWAKKTKEIGIGLYFCVGAVFGYINRRIEITLPIKGDYEFSILNFKRDIAVIRFNHICCKYDIAKSVGLRLENQIKDANYLLTTYTEFVRLNQKKKGEILLKKIKYNNTDLEIHTYSHNKNTDLYDLFYKKLIETKIPHISAYRKKNLLIQGKTGYTMSFGFGNRFGLGNGEFYTNKKYPELYRIATEYGKSVLPSNFEWNCITINYNLQCKPHFDNKNNGKSYILFLGDFTGGELIIEKDNIKELYSTDNIIYFNASLLKHSTSAFIGERFSIIYFSSFFKNL